MPPITKRVILWHAIRCLIFIKLYKKFKVKTKYNVLFALLGSGIFYSVFQGLIDKFICWLFNMK